MSASISEKLAVGNKMCHVVSFVAGGAEENVVTGLKSVDYFSIGIKSVATAGIKFANNKDSSGVASGGLVGVSGAASGDELFIVCYGK